MLTVYNIDDLLLAAAGAVCSFLSWFSKRQLKLPVGMLYCNESRVSSFTHCAGSQLDSGFGMLFGFFEKG